MAADNLFLWVPPVVPFAAWVLYGGLPQLALYPMSSSKCDSVRRAVYLTFDDGPDPDFTPRVLDILARDNVKATFFLIGERAQKNPSIVRRMVSEGHMIGNHTWHHRNAWFLTPTRTKEEIITGKKILEDIAGTQVSLYRPPWAMVNAYVLYLIHTYNLETILFNIQPEGLRARSPEWQYTYCLSRIHSGAIIDFHDAEGVKGAPVRLLAYIHNLIESIRKEDFEILRIEPALS